MSPALQIALALVPYLVPILIAALVLFFKRLEAGLPDNLRNALDSLAHQAVAAVDQMHLDTDEAKRAQAAAFIESAAHLLPGNPKLNDALTRMLIESAVHSVRQYSDGAATPEPAGFRPQAA